MIFLRLLVSVFCIISGVTAKRASTSSSILSDILDDLDLISDNRVRPGYGERPLEIQAFAFIRDIIEINEEKSTMTVNLLLMQLWNDPRLSFEGGDGKGSISEILVDNPDFMTTFWSPDTFIVNEVATNSRYMTTGGGSSGKDNLANQIIRLSKNGDILKTSRITVAVSCPMRFDSYPLHTFSCDIDMESCKATLFSLVGHKTDDILFIWRNGSRSVDLTKIDKATLAGKSSYSLQTIETHSQQSYLDTGGSYSKLIIRFNFKKLWLRHAITFFIPTAFLTVCSLLSLWAVRRRHAAAGVIGNFIVAGLLILLMALEYSTTPILSRVPILTPVDFHLGICLSTVFSSIAYHGVHFLCRNSSCYDDGRRKRAERKNKKLKQSDSITKPREIPFTTTESPKTARGILRHSKLDEDISYYESYDVTGDDEVFSDEEGEALAAGKNHEQQENQRRANNDLTVEGASGRKVVEMKKMRSKKSIVAACLLKTSLTLSKWISLLCFLITECLLWYTYVIGWGSGGGGPAIVT